jgi:hypothetical protein
VWLVVTVVACNVSPPGEWDSLQCADGIDNDADGKIDCDDPDCWAFVCAGRPSGVPEAGHPEPPRIDASVPLPDSGGIISEPLPPPVLPFDDAGPGPDDDAGTPVSCIDGWTCSPGESCVDGMCRPIDITGDYTLEVVSARVPPRSVTGVCYDFDLPCLPGTDCPGCDPDPYIVVTKNGVTTVGTTAVRNNTETPTWTTEKFDLSLKNGDRLDFAAWEYDSPIGKTRMFSCSPDLLQLASSMLSCSPAANTTIEPATGTRFEIVAKIRMVR